MNAQPEMLQGPGTLFEHTLDCYHKKKFHADKETVNKDGPLVPAFVMKLRIMDPEDFEAVVANIRGCTEEMAREWIENLTGAKEVTLDGDYPDHEVTFYEATRGKKLGVVGNCTVGLFELDHLDLGITFRIVGHEVTETVMGKLACSVGERLRVKFTRANHWMPPQSELIGRDGEVEGDANTQEDGFKDALESTVAEGNEMATEK